MPQSRRAVAPMPGARADASALARELGPPRRPGTEPVRDGLFVGIALFSVGELREQIKGSVYYRHPFQSGSLAGVKYATTPLEACWVPSCCRCGIQERSPVARSGMTIRLRLDQPAAQRVGIRACRDRDHSTRAPASRGP